MRLLNVFVRVRRESRRTQPLLPYETRFPISLKNNSEFAAQRASVGVKLVLVVALGLDQCLTGAHCLAFSQWRASNQQMHRRMST